VDEVLEQSAQSIRTQKTFTGDEDFFRGHYPHYPILPGVIACEAVFQTGALLVARLYPDHTPETQGSIPVLARIQKAKFKERIVPPASLEMKVELVEKLLQTFMMKGTVFHQGKIAVQVEFMVTLVPEGEKK
jgi:3-hydroxyacyl-[acyl-carrier-protein] dehydratase